LYWHSPTVLHTTPVVEKVIERTEVIKEQPVVKEVAVFDEKKFEAEIPKLGEPIRDALELLQDDNRLDKSAIKGLDELLKKLEKKIGSAIYVGGGGSTGGKIVKAYDLTSSLNGALKTFSLPAFWRVISVHSSSFPYVFRPTIDYTTDASAMTITFTSEIDETTTLATGQTLLVEYAEA